MGNRIKVERIILPDRNTKEQYLVVLKTKKGEIETIFHPSEIGKAYEEIKVALGITHSHSLTEDQIDQIVSFQNQNPDLCFSCQFRMKECERCFFVCESPLERTLFLSLKKADLDPKLQVWIAKNGKMYPRTSNFSPRDCLTRPDFYFENEDHKLCIYTDGFTYHNNTEEKVSKDQFINRELQKFGYKIMRFPGKDIRENIPSVISQIKEYLNNPTN